MTPWTEAHQAPLSLGFSRQEHWSGVPLPSPGNLLDLGIKSGSPTLWADSLLSEPPGKDLITDEREHWCLYGLNQHPMVSLNLTRRKDPFSLLSSASNALISLTPLKSVFPMGLKGWVLGSIHRYQGANDPLCRPLNKMLHIPGCDGRRWLPAPLPLCQMLMKMTQRELILPQRNSEQPRRERFIWQFVEFANIKEKLSAGSCYKRTFHSFKAEI